MNFDRVSFGRACEIERFFLFPNNSIRAIEYFVNHVILQAPNRENHSKEKNCSEFTTSFLPSTKEKSSGTISQPNDGIIMVTNEFCSTYNGVFSLFLSRKCLWLFIKGLRMFLSIAQWTETRKKCQKFLKHLPDITQQIETIKCFRKYFFNECSTELPTNQLQIVRSMHVIIGPSQILNWIIKMMN